ncbi:uncharacterized protein LOC124494943 isoform X2 [Dermatophagoides farinae]|uniref:uncharacterized protein LOC124494943 isoform X2 n=1 Tax=Dermatophagoides farinae TaxID=6954 RepID=UPI003F5E0DFF
MIKIITNIIIIGFCIHTTFATNSKLAVDHRQIRNSSIGSSSSNHPRYQPIILVERNRLLIGDSFIINNNSQNQQIPASNPPTTASIIPKHLQLRRQPSTTTSIDNENENLVVMTTPTYRKLKFKRPHLHHHNRQHLSQIINSNITSSRRPSFQEIILPQNHLITSNEEIIVPNDNENGVVDDGKDKNKKTATMVTAKYVSPSLNIMSPAIPSPSFLNFYGPSMLQISRMKIARHRQHHNRRVIAKRKRVVLKHMKLKPNPTIPIPNRTNNSVTDRVNVIPNENNEIRDPRPQSTETTINIIEATPLIGVDNNQLTLAVRPLFAENEEFDILRNDISKSNTAAKHLRRSLPNFLPSNISSAFQSPPNFRIQSASFGRPAPKPSSYHWSYSAPINLTSRYKAKSLSTITSEHLQPQSFTLNNDQPFQSFITHSTTRKFSTAVTPRTNVPVTSMNFHHHQHNRNQPFDLSYGARPVMSAPRKPNTNNAIVAQQQFISTPLMTNTTSTTITRRTTTTTTTPAPISITSFSRTAINRNYNDNHRHPISNYDYDFSDDHFYHNYGIAASHSVVTSTTTPAPSRRQMTNKLRTSSLSNLKNSKTDIVMTRGRTNAERCTEESCHLPYCRCGSSAIPAGLKPKDIAQLVMITFDDSINELNWDLYQDIFSNRFNPNGCPILGTFYVSHEWTDYSQVQNLYSVGHEMASHTITHSFGDKFSKEKWLNEVNGQREILSLYGGVQYEDVRGMRAPFLQPGGNRQYEMLYDANFTYDSSLPVFENNPPYWPYTFDYAMNHECMITPCPSKSFPGLWEVGMVMLIDHRGGRCSMVDACSHPSTEDGVFENLLKNFNRHYHSNKAPFGLYFHSAWFNTAHHKNGFLRFIDHIGKNKDVYFVTKWQLLQWMMQPTPLIRLKSFQPFQCDYSDRPACRQPKVCSTSHRDGPRYLKTCQKCPKHYPWVGKTGFKK